MLKNAVFVLLLFLFPSTTYAQTTSTGKWSVYKVYNNINREPEVVTSGLSEDAARSHAKYKNSKLKLTDNFSYTAEGPSLPLKSATQDPPSASTPKPGMKQNPIPDDQLFDPKKKMEEEKKPIPDDQLFDRSKQADSLTYKIWGEVSYDAGRNWKIYPNTTVSFAYRIDSEESVYQEVISKYRQKVISAKLYEAVEQQGNKDIRFRVKYSSRNLSLINQYKESKRYRVERRWKYSENDKFKEWSDGNTIKSYFDNRNDAENYVNESKSKYKQISDSIVSEFRIIDTKSTAVSPPQVSSKLVSDNKPAVQSLVGKWGKSYHPSLEIKSDGAIIWKYMGYSYGNRDDLFKRKAEVRNYKQDGNKISFDVRQTSSKYNYDNLSGTFTGEVNDDVLTGKFNALSGYVKNLYLPKAPSQKK